MRQIGFILIVLNAIWSQPAFGGVEAKPEKYVDLIKEFGLPDLPPGIKAVPGICGDEKNAYQVHNSPAYSITKDAILTVQTSSVFPDGFPSDFSIVLALRNERSNQTKAPIFTIYSDESEEVLSLSIGPEIKLGYEQIDAGFNQHNDINFGIGIDDNEWHRIGLSVKGTSATLNLDCTKQVTRRIERSLGSTIATNGLILTGVQMSNDDGFFIGDVQMMSIWDTPQAGYDLCTKYVPECLEGFDAFGLGGAELNEFLLSAPGYITSSSSSSSFSSGGGGSSGGVVSGGGIDGALNPLEVGGGSLHISSVGGGAGLHGISSNSGGGSVQISGGGSMGAGGPRIEGPIVTEINLQTFATNAEGPGIHVNHGGGTQLQMSGANGEGSLDLDLGSLMNSADKEPELNSQELDAEQLPAKNGTSAKNPKKKNKTTKKFEGICWGKYVRNI
uniref:Concanavalin A-like lectin/glucanases superfamily protein n=1 Tax=Musca domestica TaxID=7370 RepID=T1PB23_MUSDO